MLSLCQSLITVKNDNNRESDFKNGPAIIFLQELFSAARDRDKKKQDSAAIDFIINELETKLILIPIKQRHFVHYNYMCIL